MNDSTDEFKNYILETIYRLKIEHEKQLKPLYDQLVRIESIRIPTIIIANNSYVKSLMDAQEKHGTEFGTIDSPKEST